MLSIESIDLHYGAAQALRGFSDGAATVDEATHDDALAAVAAARAAFDAGDWPATPVAERAALLDRIADLLAGLKLTPELMMKTNAY